MKNNFQYKFKEIILEIEIIMIILKIIFLPQFLWLGLRNLENSPHRLILLSLSDDQIQIFCIEPNQADKRKSKNNENRYWDWKIGNEEKKVSEICRIKIWFIKNKNIIHENKKRYMRLGRIEDEATWYNMFHQYIWEDN